MPLKRFDHHGLLPLVRRHLSIEEDEGTTLLARRLRAARRRGYLTHGELAAVCRWKSARAIHQVRSNTHHRVRAATGAALASRDERLRIEALLRLRGVSIPMASAVLMLLHPRRYGVIDIRVWQLLHAVGEVRQNPRGTRFTTAQWLVFLRILRRLASRLRVGARDVERTLFEIHREHQELRLYDVARPARR